MFLIVSCEIFQQTLLAQICLILGSVASGRCIACFHHKRILRPSDRCWDIASRQWRTGVFEAAMGQQHLVLYYLSGTPLYLLLFPCVSRRHFLFLANCFLLLFFCFSPVFSVSLFLMLCICCYISRCICLLVALLLFAFSIACLFSLHLQNIF